MNCSERSCLSTLLRTVINTYLFDPIQLQNNTVCLVWDNLEFSPDFTTQGQFVLLKSPYQIHEALERTFCERFVITGSMLLPFLDSFLKAVIEVVWRSSTNKMVFVANDFDDKILSHRIVKEIPDIIFLKEIQCCLFEAYTSKYRSLYSNKPEELELLDIFNNTGFLNGVNLFPDKRDNFWGREIRLGLFDYPPFNKIFPDSESGNVWINNTGSLETYFLEGIEGNILVNYCKRYNCTIQIVTCNYGDWGTIYENLSGEGQVGMVVDRKVDIVLNSMYLWQNVYVACGMTRTMSRSGITFLIPGPK